MKKILIVMLLIAFSTSSCDTLMKTANTVLAVPTDAEVLGGLKDALSQGFTNGVSVLSAAGGFNKNAAIRILLPPEAQKIETTLRGLGMGAQVDRVIDKLNEGAENAVKTAKPIFVDAVKKMSFKDALGILTGGKSSATNYLKSTTTTALTGLFKPEIQKALDQVGVTKYWKDLVTTYNALPTVQNKLNPDLNGFVTEKALSALFKKVEDEENLIRANPAKRLTGLMKKAFAYADTKK